MSDESRFAGRLRNEHERECWRQAQAAALSVLVQHALEKTYSRGQDMSEMKGMLLTAVEYAANLADASVVEFRKRLSTDL